MLGYDYKIIYQKGKENVVVDALSPKYKEEGSLFSSSLWLLDWLVVVHQERSVDAEIVNMVHRL